VFGVSNAGIAIGVVCGVLILALLISALRNPILRRLAVRNALRWPATTILVVFGTMIGTAMITGSLVVGDNVRAWVYSDVEERLGEIDQIIYLPDPYGIADDRVRQNPDISFFPLNISSHISVEKINENLQTSGSNASVNGVLPVIQQPAPVQGLDGSTDELKGVVPEVAVLAMDWHQLANFGDSPPETGQPASGQAVISEKIAESLNIAAGDTLQIIAGDNTGDFVVNEIVPMRGIAGYGGMGWEGLPGAVMIGLDDAQALFADGESVVNSLFISHSGAVTKSQTHTGDVRSALEPLLQEVDLPVPFNIVPIKEGMTEEVTWVSAMFLIFSSFVIIAGLALTVNIYVSLAEDRRSAMGIARALGMRRGHLARLSLYEGLIHSLLAAVVGVVVGLGLARIGFLAMNRLLDFVEFETFVMRIESILTAGTAGVLISMSTVFFTILRTSHINIVAAMRGLSDPKRVHRSRWSLIWPILVILAGTGLTMLAVVNHNVFGWVLGPPILIIGCGYLVRAIGLYLGVRSLQASIVLTVTFLSAMIYAWLTNEFSTAVQQEHEATPLAFILIALVLVSGGVGIIALNLSAMLKPLHWVTSRARRALPTTRMALAYPSSKPLRTSFTILMFTIVLFVVTLMHVMIGLFSQGMVEMSDYEFGGFEVLVFPNPANPLPDLGERINASNTPELAVVDRVSALYISQLALPEYSLRDYANRRDRTAADMDGPLHEQVMGVDEVFLNQTWTRLVERAPGFDSERDVWQAMVEDSSLVVVDSQYRADGIDRSRPPLQAGDTITLGSLETGATAEKLVAGVMEEQTFWETPIRGIVVNAAALRDEFGTDQFDSPAIYLVGVEAGSDDRAVARAIEQEFVTAGVTSRSVGDVVAGEQQWFGFMRIVQGFLGFGLFVGVAGLAVVAVRAVHQRRRDIGTLRALGFRKEMVLGYFLAESSIVAIIGILLGTGIGSLSSIIIYRYVLPQGTDIEFIYPVTEVALTSLGIFVVALAFTVIPAIRASNLPVVDALRPIE
jgi:putative ABC transport system permease protein